MDKNIEIVDLAAFKVEQGRRRSDPKRVIIGNSFPICAEVDQIIDRIDKKVQELITERYYKDVTHALYTLTSGSHSSAIASVTLFKVS